MPDQRVMAETRKRVDEIAAAMEAYRERLDARYRRVALFVIAAVIISTGAVAGDLLILRHADAQATSNTKALCALRDDLKVRVRSSDDFLQTHPQGAPGLGLSAAAIKAAADGQRRTIAALSGLKCDA